MTASSPIGVIGLGRMGRDIVACLLAHDRNVVAVDRCEHTTQSARQELVMLMKTLAPTDHWQDALSVTASMDSLAACGIVIETVSEELAVKQAVYAAVEAVVDDNSLLFSNTSTIPISRLQEPLRIPGRLAGLHWGVPAHTSPFMEVIRGAQTSEDTFQKAVDLANDLGKEPTLVQRDCPGFVANRLGYALLRECFYLLENGVADCESIDRAVRQTIGAWAPMFGPFRFMDICGLQNFPEGMRQVFSDLSVDSDVPQSLATRIAENKHGADCGVGFYQYTDSEPAALRNAHAAMTALLRDHLDEPDGTQY